MGKSKKRTTRTTCGLPTFAVHAAVGAFLLWPAAYGIADSSADTGQDAAFVSSPVTPQAVKVDPKTIKADPAQIRAPITVPEGEPLPPLPPGVPTPIVDPVIQLKDEKAK